MSLRGPPDRLQLGLQVLVLACEMAVDRELGMGSHVQSQLLQHGPPDTCHLLPAA